MKNVEIFKRTMDILWKAYKDGRLVHGDACGCAVGNMVCHGLGLKKLRNSAWSEVLDSVPSNRAKIQILSTGYTDDEIIRIEAAFEDRTGSYKHVMKLNAFNDPTGHDGFINVIRVLGEIHEAPDVAECLVKSVEDGTYEFESEEFLKLSGPPVMASH